MGKWSLVAHNPADNSVLELKVLKSHLSFYFFIKFASSGENPAKISELEVGPKQTRKRRSTGAMR